MPAAPDAIENAGIALGAQYILRPRVDEALGQALLRPLLLVIAGAGYGKTHAVHQALRARDAFVHWTHLAESDNIPSRFWENLTYAVAAQAPEYAERLRAFGFPETPSRFRQYAKLPKELCTQRSRPTYIVFDDFHLITSPQVLDFVERFVNQDIPGRRVVVISRKEPGINVMALVSKGKVSVVTEETLRFTPEETAALLELRGVPFSTGDLPKIQEETHGWAFAIQLLAMAMTRMKGRQDLALAAMKQNIFKLIEHEVFDQFPADTQKTLARLAMVSHLPIGLLQKMSAGASVHAASPIHSFLWHDSFSGDCKVHPLFLEFLRSKEYLVSEGEKEEVYRWAADWCAEHDYHVDAMTYYAKLRDYGHMVAIALSYVRKLPRDAAEYYLHILEEIVPLCQALGYPVQTYEDSMLQLLVKQFIPWLLTVLGRYGEAEEKTLAAIREWEDSLARYGDGYVPLLLFGNYNQLGYINLYTCVTTHRYEFHRHFETAMRYFRMSPHPIAAEGHFTSADMRSFACLVGVGAGRRKFGEFLEAARQAVKYIPLAMKGLYGGYDDLCACELAFYRNRPEECRRLAHKAISNARANAQYGIEAMAVQYLLRAAVQDGDYSLAREMLRQLRGMLDIPQFWNRQLLYDLYTGYFYAHIGLHSLVAPWLTANTKNAPLDSHLPAREQLLRVKCLCMAGKFDEALAVLNRPVRESEAQERFLLGEVARSVFGAVARLRTGDAEGAMAEFERAYKLSFNGEFVTYFIDLGKHMHLLAAEALKKPGCAIPREWLLATDKKAAVYAKKVAFIASAYKSDNEIGDAVKLTEREQQLLGDLYQGLSRAEIAASRYLSINTVKTLLQGLYAKLGAENNVDAVRIAIEKKLL
ncbi:MAG: LuxR C-terminal-related transcriptional regulator [Oscillospiraceae bacterium]|jgi:LuxR family maltose regulon positive regulatory protein|nr:LuxR C-terminal-related transcriptional regulator [Oscillospiraceae bacterium]